MSPARARIRTRTATALRLESLERREVPAVVGALDPSFGGGDGLVLTGAFTNFNGVAVQPDGKVVAVGSSGVDFAVYRFLPDGSPDVAFGVGGRTIVDIDGAGNTDTGRAVVLDSAGRIVVVGEGGAGNPDFALVRLTPAGAVDINRSYAVGVLGSAAKAVAFQSDGTIVMAGRADLVGNSDFAVLRVDGAGNPVGVATVVSMGGLFDDVKAVTVFGPGPDQDKIVVAGDVGGGVVLPDFGLLRLSATGAAAGQATYNLGGGDTVGGVAVTADGRILVGGTTNAGGSARFTLLRVNNDATLTRDTTFNPTGAGSSGAGEARLDLGSAAAMAVQPDGKVVLAGTRTVTTIDPVVARANADGTADTTFNSPAGSRVIPGISTAAGSAVALTPTGRVVLAGSGNGLAVGFVARLIGTVEKGTQLAVGGTADGKAAVYAPAPVTGQYAAAGSAAPFGVLGTNVRTAVADVNGDFIPDTVLVTGPGVPIRFAVVSGADNATLLVPPTAPFVGSESFTGGGFVAAADLDGDGRAEFALTPDQGGGPRVTVFSLAGGSPVVRANFFGIDDANFRGGARAAFGDVDGDGVADLAVAAGFLGGPRVAVFDGTTLLGTPARLVNDFFAFPGEDAARLRNGAYVAAGDVDGDGKADLIFGGGPGGAPRVFVLGGALVSAGDVSGAQAAPVANFFVAGNSADRGGVRVAAADADRDGRAEVVAGSGEGVASRVRVYLGKSFTGPAEPAAFQDLDPFGGAALPGGVFVG